MYNNGKDLRPNKGAPLDPAVNDPVAMNVSNWAMVDGGNRSQTHTLVRVGPTRLEFQTSLIVFSLRFFIYLVIFGVFIFYHFESPFNLCYFIAFAVVSQLLLAIFRYFFGPNPVIFDKQKGILWDKDQVGPSSTRLEDIHAVQVLSKHIERYRRSYYSFELNLVLKNGRRVNVIDHGNRTAIEDDAFELGQFLKVPIWNNIFMDVYQGPLYADHTYFR